MPPKRLTESLTSKLDKSASAKLKDEVQELQAELAQQQSSQINTDKIRAKQSADYMQTKTDLELGLKGVGKALGVLRDYYGGGAAYTRQEYFLRFYAAACHAQDAKSSGAGQSINMVEVVESFCSKNIATAEAEEADSANDYDKITQENKVSKSMKEQEVKYKTQEFKGLDKSIAELSSDKDTTSTELSAVMEYYCKLKDRCVAKPETYAERASRCGAKKNALP